MLKNSKKKMKKKDKKIESRNNFENNVFQMKSQLKDEKISSLLDDELKSKLNKIMDDATSWLDNNQSASKEEYDSD